MNFKEEYQKRIESIESILEKYLPVQEGYQKIIMGQWSTASWLAESGSGLC